MNFACFNCFAVNDENDKECYACGMPLNFPLENFPQKIQNFEIERSLGRGFYGVTYIASDELEQPVVLKVAPKKLYEDNNKDFIAECKLHAKVTKGTSHLVKIKNIIESQQVTFGDIQQDCHIAVLEYVDGETLKKVIEERRELKIETIAQIAIDLLKILHALSIKKIHHNDLHPANIMIEILNSENKKSGNIDKFTNVVAIDLGSISEESKSENNKRKNDVHYIANYMQLLSKQILEKPSTTNQKDFRVALALDRIARMLMPHTENHRLPDYEEIIDDIKSAYEQESNPWRHEKLKLKNIGQFYNAQNLHSWNVPDLFVEEDAWLNNVTSQGPLIITGMRGCGKTMLLKSMQVHARIRYADNHELSPKDLIRQDGFFGIFISSNRLLDEPGKTDGLHEPLTKLFLAYGIESLIALRHLKEIDDDNVKDDYYKLFLDIYQIYFAELKTKSILSDNSLERELQILLSLIHMNKKQYELANPIYLFSQLAKVIKSSSNLLSSHYVLFLLDDISTRYLNPDIIKSLLSSLIFQDENCAFKFTSEEQTMYATLYSPGMIEKAKVGRDVEVFDLGDEVYKKTKKAGNAGKGFVLKILEKRKEHSAHPNSEPKEVLGDQSLKEIANNIIEKKNKNAIYHGVSALTGVCVGDIGDIILLYKNILEKRQDDSFPVPARIQHECFLELSNIRLQDLKKRTKELENYALSFAEATYDLLIDSSKKHSNNDTGSSKTRLREYASIYINNTSGNTEKHYEKIRELVDAGVFVFMNGSKNLRTSGSGQNPTNQFILLYRKILGLSKLIGLSQSDRFELAGDNLQEWISSPTDGKRILKGSVEKKFHSEDETEDEIEDVDILQKNENLQLKGEITKQKNLLELMLNDINENIDAENNGNNVQYIQGIIPKITKLHEKGIHNEVFDFLIAALGFEERTFESLKRIYESCNISKVLLVEYSEKVGFAENILEFIASNNINYEIIKEADILDYFEADKKNKILFDITGMSKSLIFKVSRQILENYHELSIAHTFANEYAPKESLLKPFLDELKESQNKIEMLNKVTEGVSMGERMTEFSMSDLLDTYSDKSKSRVLISMCNVKYEKLFQLMNKREFDTIDILVSDKDSIRNKIAKIASDVIKINYSEVNITISDTGDLLNIVNYLATKYYQYFVNQGANMELALTGNKLYSLACGIISAKVKISNSWYLTTHDFNYNEFSEGVGETEFYTIRLT